MTNFIYTGWISRKIRKVNKKNFGFLFTSGPGSSKTPSRRIQNINAKHLR